MEEDRLAWRGSLDEVRWHLSLSVCLTFHLSHEDKVRACLVGHPKMVDEEGWPIRRSLTLVSTRVEDVLTAGDKLETRGLDFLGRAEKNEPGLIKLRSKLVCLSILYFDDKARSPKEEAEFDERGNPSAYCTIPSKARYMLPVAQALGSVGVCRLWNDSSLLSAGTAERLTTFRKLGKSLYILVTLRKGDSASSVLQRKQ